MAGRRWPWAVNIYRTLLRLYPRAFRREYGGAMAQLFCDQLREARGRAEVRRLWAHTLVDTIAGAAREHVDALERRLGMSVKRLALVAGLAVMIAALLGYVDEHVYEVQWVVIFTLPLCFVVGLLDPNPKRAWVWALFVPLGLVLAAFVSKWSGYTPAWIPAYQAEFPDRPVPTSDPFGGLISIIPALIGVYGGVLVSKLAGTLRGRPDQPAGVN